MSLLHAALDRHRVAGLEQVAAGVDGDRHQHAGRALGAAEDLLERRHLDVVELGVQVPGAEAGQEGHAVPARSITAVAGRRVGRCADRAMRLPSTTTSTPRWSGLAPSRTSALAKTVRVMDPPFRGRT